MSTPRDILFETVRHGRSERQLLQYEAFKIIMGNPVGAYLNAGMKPGATYKNPWGVTFTFPLGEPGTMPLCEGELKVCPDITKWRETVHAPDIAAVSGSWEPCQMRAREIDTRQYLATGIMPTGIFEQLHQLMGFEDTLANFYEEPEAMHELIAYILEYKLTYARLLIENLPVDAMLSHDDWGALDRLFMSPDMWREFFKEPYRKLYGYMREQGVLVVHHADSYLAPIVEDMAEIGIDIWQGVLPENDIPALQKKLDGRMTLMGGIGAAIDRADSTEEEVRAYVRSACETYCPGGYFIPCITYGGPGALFPHVDPIVNDEIRRYNEDTY